MALHSSLVASARRAHAADDAACLRRALCRLHAAFGSQLSTQKRAHVGHARANASPGAATAATATATATVPAAGATAAAAGTGTGAAAETHCTPTPYIPRWKCLPLFEDGMHAAAKRGPKDVLLYGSSDCTGSDDGDGHDSRGVGEDELDGSALRSDGNEGAGDVELGSEYVSTSGLDHWRVSDSLSAVAADLSLLSSDGLAHLRAEHEHLDLEFCQLASGIDASAVAGARKQKALTGSVSRDGGDGNVVDGLSDGQNGVGDSDGDVVRASRPGGRVSMDGKASARVLDERAVGNVNPARLLGRSCQRWRGVGLADEERDWAMDCAAVEAIREYIFDFQWGDAAKAKPVVAMRAAPAGTSISALVHGEAAEREWRKREMEPDVGRQLRKIQEDDDDDDDNADDHDHEEDIAGRRRVSGLAALGHSGRGHGDLQAQKLRCHQQLALTALTALQQQQEFARLALQAALLKSELRRAFCRRCPF
eukprot:6190438-Pleurochrysis_carterae.AAC.1